MANATVITYPIPAGSGGSGDGVSAGASGEIQYADGAEGFLAEAAFNYNATTDTLTVPNVVAGSSLTVNGALVSAAGLALIDDAAASNQRTTLGLVAIAASGSASDLSTGTIPDARMPDLTGDVTTSEGAVATSIGANKVTTTKILDGNVTLAKLADIATDRLIGRDTAGTGVPEALTVGGGIEFTGSAGIQRSALTGDVTASAGSGSTTIASNAVTTAKIAASNVTMDKLSTTEIDDGNSSTADTIDFSAGPNHISTLTGNCTYTFTLPTNDGRVQLRLVQDGTGGRTVTWPASVIWAGGAAPTVNTGANTVHIITFFVDVSATKYYGVPALSFS